MGYATAIPFVIVKGFILADLTFHVGKLLSQAAPSTQFLPSALAEVGALKEGDEVWIREDQLPHPIQVLLINGRNLIIGGAEDKWYR